jgi:hypothetical protein
LLRQLGSRACANVLAKGFAAPIMSFIDHASGRRQDILHVIPISLPVVVGQERASRDGQVPPSNLDHPLVEQLPDSREESPSSAQAIF